MEEDMPKSSSSAIKDSKIGTKRLDAQPGPPANQRKISGGAAALKLNKNHSDTILTEVIDEESF